MFQIVTGAFVATFFIVSELAGDYLSSQFGTVLGILCTGALVFLFEPIQRASERGTGLRVSLPIAASEA